MVLIPSSGTKDRWAALQDFVSSEEAHTAAEKESVFNYQIGGVHKKLYDNKYFTQQGSFYLCVQKQRIRNR